MSRIARCVMHIKLLRRIKLLHRIRDWSMNATNAISRHRPHYKRFEGRSLRLISGRRRKKLASAILICKAGLCFAVEACFDLPLQIDRPSILQHRYRIRELIWLMIWQFILAYLHLSMISRTHAHVSVDVNGIFLKIFLAKYVLRPMPI